MITTGLTYGERAIQLADAFVEEVKREIERAARRGEDVPPRLRSVHERPGHTTPEYRTLAIPLVNAAGASPEVLSGAIARFARQKPATCLMLAIDAATQAPDGAPASVLIAEVRERAGARYFMLQPYQRDDSGSVLWLDPVDGGWRVPGDDDEMILDAAFSD